MKNPPDFVMYVVMFRPADYIDFNPWWGDGPDGVHGRCAKGFSRKQDADKECKICRVRYGKKNAYVQQYGPLS